MALLRNLIIWCCFFAPAISFAETIPATALPANTDVGAASQGYHLGGANTGLSYSTICSINRSLNGMTACNSDTRNATSWASGASLGDCWGRVGAGSCYPYTNFYGQWICPPNTNQNAGRCISAVVTYSCPSTGGWTLSGTGSSSVCSRAECVSPQVRNSETGLCVAPPCTAGRTFAGSFFGGWRVGPAANQVVGPSGGSYSAPVTQCNGGCVFTSGGATCTSSLAPFVDQAQPITCTGTLTETGAECSVDNTATPSTAPVIPNHRPKCLPTEGVLTSSSGTVACVPSGTPSSVPVVRSDKAVQQFPDGSAKTTETTYTKDPATGVQDTQQTITNTPATAGGAGMAGTPGTTSSGASTQPSTGTDKTSAKFCEENAQLQICQGDMNKEETQIQVRDYIKSLTDPASTAYTAIEEAKQSTQADADYKVETDKFTAASDGTFSPDSASKGSWGSAMSSGWFEPVTRAGCSPYTATVGGRTWNLDICPTAEKISVISEYVIWFLLVVGTFVMFTGGAISRNN